MNFLIVGSYPDSLVNFRGPLIKALVKGGCVVHAAAPGLEPGSEHFSAIADLGAVPHAIPMRRTGTNPAADLRTLLALFFLMRRLKVDAVLAYTVKPVVYGMLAAALARVPRKFSLITGLGYAFQGASDGVRLSTRSIIRRVVRSLYRLSLARANVVFFQNPDDEALFVRDGLLSGRVRSVVVSGSGVDIQQYGLTDLPDGASGSNAVFLLIARLLGDKGVREYVAAAREVRRRHPGVAFRLVGWIDENPDAVRQEELDAWIAEGTIEYLGRLSDVRPAIAGCTVYVLPSYREGTPRTVLEAMAMGRAIVTTDAPGCRETVADGENGFLVAVGSAQALAAAMEKFIDSPDLAITMGRRSREIAERRYDVNLVNSVMLREMGVGKSRLC